MGRILEALCKDDPKRCAPPPSALALHAVPVEGNTSDDELIEGEVPFIEVGGRRAIIDASPDVMACAPPSSPRLTFAEKKTEKPALKSVSFRAFTPHHGSSASPGRFAPDLVAFHQPDHPLSKGCRALLAGLMSQLPANQANILLFTALHANVGSASVVLNTAITAARQPERRVLVMDANRRHAEMAARLGLPAAPGLREVLTGSASLQQVLRATGLERLMAMTAGNAGDDGVIPLVLEAMPLVLRLLREQFDLIFVDASSSAGVGDALSLAASCDAAYVVVEQGQADSPEVAKLLQQMQRQSGLVSGCVLTEC